MGDPSVDGRIILIWIFRKWDGEQRTGLLWIRIWAGGMNFSNAVMNIWVP
jgi:hypothetical protein